MAAKDLAKELKLRSLDLQLRTVSFINGTREPSGGDLALFLSTSTPPDPGVYPHAARWWYHIGRWARSRGLIGRRMEETKEKKENREKREKKETKDEYHARKVEEK